MPILLVIASVLATCGAAGLGAYWAVVLWHVRRSVKTVPTCRDGIALPRAADLLKPTAPKVCIIVPAHNEAGVVGRLARSLLRQTYPNLSVVFCLDRCTDSTASEVREAIGDAGHVAVLEIAECPTDWAGKVNAVRRGVRDTPHARDADLLLFTDADTEFDPECVRAAVALLQERNVGMLSLMSTLTSERWFELITQPAAGMELMRQYPLVRANVRPGEHRRAFANGQFMLFTREAYEKLGGHEAVHNAVLEDVALARLSERKAVPGALLMANGMLRCRMYANYAEFRRGWSRIYMESANRRVKRLREIGIRARILGGVLPLLAVGACILGTLEVARFGPDTLAIITLATGSIAILIMLAALAWVYRLSHAPLAWLPLYPIGAWQVGGIMLSAAHDLATGVPVKWAGKEYVREAR